jgi:hypothetical protein
MEATGILAERWPTVSRAIGSYQQGLAERFTRLAYDRISAGVIRLDDRRDLAAAAEDLGIRAFDAQLLIACAVRQWALDRRFDPSPSQNAPALSPEYRAWRRVWSRVALVIVLAMALDGIILWKWLF